MNVRSRRRPTQFLNQNQSTAPDDYSRKHKPDHWLLILTSLLLVIGFVVVYSISPGLSANQHISQNYFITKQLIEIGLGVLAFTVAAFFPINRVLSLIKPLIIVTIVGSLLVMITPLNEAYPAHRWIRFGGFSFQIVELIKLTLILWLSSFLALRWQQGRVNDLNSTLKPLLALMLVVGFVVAKLQSDLGSAAVIVAIAIFMVYAVGIPLSRLATFGLIIVAMVGLAIATSPYRRERVAAFLHPDNNCQGSSYQACQALIAIGSGGLFGLGLGYSVQAYGYLPEASNDSIFAIMAEKFGFIGSTMIIVLYGLYIARLRQIIQHSANQAYRLVVIGTLAWLSTQMLINVGAMIGLLPLKGITLPLISQGGTSLVFLTAALGLVFQISRYTSYNVTEPNQTVGGSQNENNSTSRRGVGRAYRSIVAARPRT